MKEIMISIVVIMFIVSSFTALELWTSPYVNCLSKDFFTCLLTGK